MFRKRQLTIAMATTLVGAAACIESTNPEMFTLGSAFSTATAGFGEVSSSFASTADAGMPWQPEHGGRGPGGRGFGGPPGGGPGMGGFMGGGMDANFLGGVSAGRGPDRGPFAVGDLTGCTFSAATGDVTCPTVTRGNSNVSVTRIYTFKTANGTAQAAPDSTTNSIRTRITSNGTVQRRDSVTATVSNRSDRTVTGTAAGSTQRIVNGTSAGNENASGKTRDGVAFTSVRTLGDTTSGLTIPVVDGRPTYPTAGTVVRSMRVVMTVNGTSRDSYRREVITYNGTATATLVITQDGTTKTCSLPLPVGRPTCQ